MAKQEEGDQEVEDPHEEDGDPHEEDGDPHHDEEDLQSAPMTTAALTANSAS